MKWKKQMCFWGENTKKKCIFGQKKKNPSRRFFFLQFFFQKTVYFKVKDSKTWSERYWRRYMVIYPLETQTQGGSSINEAPFKGWQHGFLERSSFLASQRAKKNLPNKDDKTSAMLPSLGGVLGGGFWFHNK